MKDPQRLERVRRFARLLDASIRLPGGFRIGLDGILGLAPGIGDISGAILSSYILYEARRMGAPRLLLLRMAMNVCVETLIGVIPVAGDLFDFYYKANLRNLALFEKFLEKKNRHVPTD